MVVMTQGLMSMQTVGLYLRGLREAAKLTQSEAGEKVGVTGKTVERWEAGENEPPASRLAAYVEAIGGSVAQVIEILSGKPLTTEDETWFRSLSPAQRRKVRALLDAAEE